MLTPEEINSMRIAGKIVADTLQLLVRLSQPGILTTSLNRAAEFRIAKSGGVPACKGYHGFPASVCISINDEVIHGVPDGRALKEGDVVSFDLAVSVDGIHADSAVTVPVGRATEEIVKLLRVTRTALYDAVGLCKPDTHILSLSLMIDSVARLYGYHMLKNFGGHGIGKQLHQEPFVPNINTFGAEALYRLKAGEAIAIEPMVCQGDGTYEIKKDGWTVYDPTGMLSAHFEHTVLITENGHEIITEWNDQSSLPSLLR